MTTFRRIAAGHYVHDETGVEIVKIPAHREYGYNVGVRWVVRRPALNFPDMFTYDSARTLAAAQQLAAGETGPVAAMREQITEAWDEAHRENEDRDGVVRPIHHLHQGFTVRVSCGLTDFYYADTTTAAAVVTCEACRAADEQAHMERVREAIPEDHAEALLVNAFVDHLHYRWWGAGFKADGITFDMIADMAGRLIEYAHADALAEDIQRGIGRDAGDHEDAEVTLASIFAEADRRDGCTAAYGWLDEHLYENEPIELNSEGYDEYERCGRPADDPLHIEAAHALALSWNSIMDRTEQTARLGWIGRVRDARDAASAAGNPIGLREAMELVRDEDHEAAIDEALDRWLDSGPECACQCRSDGSGHAARCPRMPYVVAGPLNDDRGGAAAAEAERLRLIDQDHAEALGWNTEIDRMRVEYAERMAVFVSQYTTTGFSGLITDELCRLPISGDTVADYRQALRNALDQVHAEALLVNAAMQLQG